MKVILLEKIHKLGDLGDIVQVKSGYGRNYLIPQGKAVSAIEVNVAKFEARRAELEKAAADVLAVAQKRAEALKDLNVVIASKTQEAGKLFGSVSAKDVVDAMTEKGLTIEKREVIFPEGVIHKIGVYEITVRLHSDVVVPIKLSVTDESGRLEIEGEEPISAAIEEEESTVEITEEEPVPEAEKEIEKVEEEVVVEEQEKED